MKSSMKSKAKAANSHQAAPPITNSAVIRAFHLLEATTFNLNAFTFDGSPRPRAFKPYINDLIGRDIEYRALFIVKWRPCPDTHDLTSSCKSAQRRIIKTELYPG